jgi:hypothetical protein
MLDTEIKTIKTPEMSVMDSLIIDSQVLYACPICGTKKLVLLSFIPSQDERFLQVSIEFNCGNGHYFVLNLTHSFDHSEMKVIDCHTLQRGRVPYLEYLQTEGWKRRSKEAMERAGYKCALDNRSGNEYTLHTHHKTYENIGHEKPEDLIVLCDECHGKFHGKVGVNAEI